MERRQELLVFMLFVTLRVVHLQQTDERPRIGSCPRPTVDDLGRRDMLSREGLVALSYVTNIEFDIYVPPENLPEVRIFAYAIVCEASGLIRDSISSFSVVVDHECRGMWCGDDPDSRRIEQYQYDCVANQYQCAAIGTFFPPHKVGNRAVRSAKANLTIPSTLENVTCGECSAETINGLDPDPDTHCVGKCVTVE